MLTVFIIIGFACWAAGFVINGFTLYAVLCLAPTIMFALRKFDIHVKMSHILATEIILLFFSITLRLIFHKFFLVKFLLTLLVRAIFIGIVAYDDHAYVYVSEERKKK
jgi:hypothetical protein